VFGKHTQDSRYVRFDPREALIDPCEPLVNMGEPIGSLGKARDTCGLVLNQRGQSLCEALTAVRRRALSRHRNLRFSAEMIRGRRIVNRGDRRFPFPNEFSGHMLLWRVIAQSLDFTANAILAYRWP
jgi:hypothetical protein